jgi:GR25 family glycosyltransferase involved in LPS biosynthesis
MKNMENQQMKVDQKIQIYDAVKGDDLNMDELMKTGRYNNNVLLNNTLAIKKRQIGCYLSHYQLYEKVKQLQNPGYTIIFEDDFLIKPDNLLDDVNSILNKIDGLKLDFDILFLGNLNDNHGEHIVDSLHYIDKNVALWGTHGYIIKNSNIDKILEKTHFVSRPIDEELAYLSKNGEINAIVLYPTLVDQLDNADSKSSTIMNVGIENFSQRYSFIN